MNVYASCKLNVRHRLLKCKTKIKKQLETKNLAHRSTLSLT